MISDSLLQGVYLFTDLSADERTSMAKIAEEMSLAAGFPIFRAGDPATALYLIDELAPSRQQAGTAGAGDVLRITVLPQILCQLRVGHRRACLRK